MASKTHTHVKGMLLDVQMHEHESKSVVDVYVRTENGVECYSDSNFPPYFYITLVSNARPNEIVKQLREETFPGGISLVDASLSKREGIEFVKLEFKRIPDLLSVREKIKSYPFVEELYEYNIPYTKRYLIDKQLTPYEPTALELNSAREIVSISNTEKISPPILRTGAFDLEAYAPKKLPIPEKNPVISISIASPSGNKVFLPLTFSHAHAVSGKDEVEMFHHFSDFCKLADLDVIFTYNGDRFDFPFLHARAHTIHAPLDFGNGNVQLIGKGNEATARLHGIQHVDVYQLMRLLSRFAVFKSPKMDLGSVMQAVFGEGEKIISYKKINEIWETKKDLQLLVEYNLNDSIFTLRLGNEFLPLLMELSKLVRQSLYDVNRSTSSQLVETMLIHESFAQQRVIPNPPTDEQVMHRTQNPIEGGFVKEPVAGLREDIAVLDFRSMYPSIMISHNISPDTLDCEHEGCKKGKNLAPTGHWFCTKRKGLFTTVLERILDARIAVQAEMDSLPKKDPKLIALKARKQALKIVLNSFFGTLAYPRFRWYTREGARAITAFARHYIRETLDVAEKAGFEPIYGDTDSAFVHVPKGRSEKDVVAFVEKVNKSLPGRMEVEFEGFYVRGLFVTKKDKKAAHAAKKRYALADKQGELTIVGFEYVRRDWSQIARQTQKKVLEEVLAKGNPSAALRIVQETITRLRAGKIPKKELIVMTQLQRRPDKYASVGPHVAAAMKAQKRGKEIEVGQLLSYIITQKGKSISEKAELEEFVEEGDYDAEYYIHHQLIPAVITILSELGYTEDDLKQGGKQTGLGAFG